MTSPSGAELGLREYFEGSLDLYCEIDDQGVFQFVNRAWELTLGHPILNLIGRPFVDFLHPDDRAHSVDVFQDPDPPGKGFFRNRYRHKNGHYLTFLWSGHTDHKRRLTYAHARDVTDEFRKSNLLGRVASIQNTYMRYGTNKRGLFDQVLQELLKATESELGFIGEIRDGTLNGAKFLGVYAITGGLERQNLTALSAHSIETGTTTIVNDLAHLPKPLDSDESKISSFCGVPLYYSGEHIGMIGVANRRGGYSEEFLDKMKPVIEATASVVGLFHASQRENALRERFMVTVENLPIMLTEFGPDGRITWANRFFREKLGWSESEIASTDLLPEILDQSPEEERARTFMLSGRTDWQDFNLRGKDGKYFQSSWTNVRLKDGRAIGIGQDISDRRAAEAKMVQSSKMASLGEMSAGVSHEINNPLAIIQGSAFRAIQNLEGSSGEEGAHKRDDVEGDLNRIIQNCDRIARIVRGLRAFSRSADHEPFIPTPLATVIEDVLNLAHERFKSQNIELHIELGEPHIIDCRPVQMAQVLMNLLNNAYDAVSEHSGPLRAVWVRAKEVGDHIQISVEDTGPGIPPDVQNRILEPFFTTKDIGKGTGLGLSISKGIIESHEGRLWLDASSKRTRFVIELPIRQNL